MILPKPRKPFSQAKDFVLFDVVLACFLVSWGFQKACIHTIHPFGITTCSKENIKNIFSYQRQIFLGFLGCAKSRKAVYRFQGKVNKSELINALAEKTSFSKKDAEKALNAFVETINTALAKGEKVQLIGFGTFDVKKRPARTARNPRTGAEIKIKASKAPTFKAGKALKDKVNAKKKAKK